MVVANPIVEPSGWKEARRILEGLTARSERQLLAWMAARTPGWVTSDQLTLLGLAASLGCGLSYALSALVPALLFVASVCLALNWLGDSLDGTLARHRHLERPRFGFYVDHLSDAIGALFLVAGLGASGLMTPLVAAALLVAYFLLAIETYLATYALGRFRISWGPVGGTELRIVLMALNTVVYWRPRWQLGTVSFLLFDLFAVAATAVLTTLAVVAGITGARALAREEALAKRQPPPR